MSKTMNTKRKAKKCRQIRAWLYETINKYAGPDAGWIQSHISNCPRCQLRLAGVGRVHLSLAAIKSQPHRLELLKNANTQAISVLKHSLRDAPKAEKLRLIQPEPKLLERANIYKRPLANIAACIAILILVKIGVFSSMAKFQAQGQQTIKQYYAAQLGEDLTNEIFTA